MSKLKWILRGDCSHVSETFATDTAHLGSFVLRGLLLWNKSLQLLHKMAVHLVISITAERTGIFYLVIEISIWLAAHLWLKQKWKEKSTHILNAYMYILIHIICVHLCTYMYIYDIHYNSVHKHFHLCMNILTLRFMSVIHSFIFPYINDIYVPKEW